MSAKTIFLKRTLGVLTFVFLVALARGSIVGQAHRASPDLPDAGIAIMDWSLNQQDSAIAYSSGANNFLVVWQHQWAVDSYTVINGRLVQADGTPALDVIGVSQTAKNASAPSVTYNNASGEFLVVWEQEYISSDHDIYARRVDSTGTPLGIDLVISQDSAYESAPVVAYNATLNQYMVAWVYHVALGGGAYVDRIYAQRLDASGVSIGSKTVVGSSAGNAIAPHLVYNPTSQEYLLAWSGQDAGGDYDIFGQRLLANGVMVGSVINLSTWDNHQLYPRLAYNPDRDEYIAVWQDYHWDIGISQVYGQRLQVNGALMGGPIIPLNQSSQGNRVPDVAYQPQAHGFMLVWEYVYSPSDYDLYRTLISGTGGVLQSTSTLTGHGANEKRPALASDQAGGVQFAWDDSRNFTSTGIDIYGLRQEVQLPTFSGHVYQGESGDHSTPLSGVTVSLYCSNSADAAGDLLSANLTDVEGAFVIPCYHTCEYYNIIETDPVDYFSVASQSPTGVIKSSNWIQFAHPLEGETLSGNKFWDLPETTVDSQPPGNWTGFQPDSWSTSQVPEASVQVEDSQSGLEIPTAEFAFSIDNGSSWSSWQPAGCSGAGGSTTPERVYADVPFGQDSGPASDNLVKFRISDRTGNPGESPVYAVMVDSNPPWNPSGMFSTSHTPSEWSNNNQVTVEWDPAYDAVSGVYGYAISWDQSPGTLPDTYRDLVGHSYTNLAAVDSSGYYFHLRTLDVAGNATPDAIHSGPYRIDTQPPTVAYLSPGGAVNSQYFTVSWSGDDSLSGVHSYDVQSSLDGSNWANWHPDATFTSANFIGERGNDYYFRVRARDHAGNLSAWVYSGMVHVGVDVTVRVRNEFGDNIHVAEIYFNNDFIGFSDEVGYFDLHDVVLGDQLAAADQVHERYSNKPAHRNYGIGNWAWKEYHTSIHIEDSGATTQFTVSDTSVIQDLVVRRNQALVMVHILVSVEFDAEPSEMETMRAQLIEASNYLYDVTDGQFVWGRVEVFDNKENWENADVRVYANHGLRAHTNWAIGMWYGLGGLTAGTDMQIHLPAVPDSRTFIHEFGHYGLWLADEYLDRDGEEDTGAQCTTGFIHKPSPEQIDNQASIMYDADWSSELCSRLDPINQHSTNTFQDEYNDGETTWETVLRHYSGNWIDLISPDIRGAVVAGPDAIPITNWVQVDVTDNDTSACSTFTANYVWLPTFAPAEGISVWLVRNPAPLMYLGKTAANGDILIRGAHDGEVLVSSKYEHLVEALGSYSARLIVNCSAQASSLPSPDLSVSTLSQPDLQFSTSPRIERPIEMQPDPFSLFVSFIPLDGETLEVQVKTTTALPSPPLAKIWQNGSNSSIDTPLTYNPDLNLYTGQATINSALGRQGTAEVQAADSDGQTVLALAPFNIEAVSAEVINPYLRSSDGYFELMLPAGALDSDAYLAIQETQPGPTQQDSLEQVGSAYYVVVSSGKTMLNVPTPVNLYFHADLAANVDLATLRLYYWDAETNRWLPSGDSRVGLDHNLVSSRIDQLGVLALFGEPTDLMRIYLPLILGR